MPDRSSSAGDWIEPAATTTTGARTVSVAAPAPLAAGAAGSVQAASTPAARPSSTSTRAAAAPTKISAPSACASTR